MIKRAIISVSNKTGIVEFSQQLAQFGIEIIATGNTAKVLKQNNIDVVEISDFTGFPEILDGRVKTLHPKIYGGILARRGQDEEVLAKHDLQPIDLVVVNLYPFEEQNSIENIDIGGPTLLRAAAKNHEYVTVVVEPQNYPDIFNQIKSQGNTTLEFRKKLATKVFQHTTRYDQSIAQYFSESSELRYGENPHQQARFYAEKPLNIIQGKALSYNNLVDADAALSCVQEFPENISACVIVKHATPCGVALGKNILYAYEKAYLCDSQSAFGGIIAFNQVLDENTAKIILDKQFVEVILAPEVTEDAKNILSTKPNCRVLIYENKKTSQKSSRSVLGGLLVQDSDTINAYDLADLKIATDKKPSEVELHDLIFAQTVVKYIKSNAIVYAKNQQTLGIGGGQTSRVFSAKIAMLKAEEAGLELKNSVMASDAFFPFPDSIEIAAKAGISAIIQPGGSKNDPAVIDKANELGLSMVFTGVRHFRH